MNDKQTLTLEAGKFYRTRNGRKAFVGCENPFADGSTLRVFGYIEGAGIAIWRTDGCYFSDGAAASSDLVAEWVEPKRIKGWVNIDEDYCAYRYDTRKQADAKASKDRIACIEIDVLEGEGL